MKFVKKIALMVLAVALVTWESLIYRPSKYLFDKLDSFALLKKAEDHVRQLPPWAALLSFFGVIIAVLPFKLLAVYLLRHGHALSALSCYIGAKVVGGFLFTRLFDLTETSLRKIYWLNTALTKFFEYKAKLVMFYQGTETYKHVKRWSDSTKATLAALKNIVKRMFS